MNNSYDLIWVGDIIAFIVLLYAIMLKGEYTIKNTIDFLLTILIFYVTPTLIILFFPFPNFINYLGNLLFPYIPFIAVTIIFLPIFIVPFFIIEYWKQEREEGKKR